MSAKRRQRIDRLIELRGRALKDEVALLARAQLVEKEAEEAEARARALAADAEQQRRSLALIGADIQTFIQIEEWLANKQYDREVALHRLTQARIHRGRVQLRVKAARTKVKQAEKLAERLLLHERAAAARAERKMEDEFSGRIAAHGSVAGYKRGA